MDKKRLRLTLVNRKSIKKRGQKWASEQKEINSQKYNGVIIPLFERLVAGNQQRRCPWRQTIYVEIDGVTVAAIYCHKANRWEVNGHTTWMRKQIDDLRRSKLYQEEIEAPNRTLMEEVVAYMSGEENIFSNSPTPETPSPEPFLYDSLAKAIDFVCEQVDLFDKPVYWPLVWDKKENRLIVDPQLESKVFDTQEDAMDFVKDHADLTKVICGSSISPGEEYLLNKTVYY